MFGLSPGDLPTWIAAIIALLALIVAVVSVFFSAAAAFVPAWLWWQERKERQEAESRRDAAEQERNAVMETYQRRELERLESRERRDAKERREAQARLFHVWVREQPLPSLDDPYFPESPYEFELSNTSLAPVGPVWIDCELTFFDRGGDGATDLFSDDQVPSSEASVRLDWVAPTGTEPLRKPVGMVRLQRELSGNLHLFKVRIVRVMFTDADGVTWERDPGWGLENADERLLVEEPRSFEERENPSRPPVP